MANEEALGPRKTAFVAVIVVGCFAVLWPRILSPMFLGPSREQLKPNQYDRDAGCCEVMFATEVAVMEVLNAVCGSLSQADGKLSPYAAAECRKTVNETCGVDIQVFLKRSENVGKTTKGLLDMMRASNSSCLKEHFGVPVLSLSTHTALNSWMLQDTLKQERAPIRAGGTHPALRERGRAIPPAAFVAPPPPRPAPLPPHVRVRLSPLQGYFEIDIKPPPIPGMRPPLGSPGGPVAAPKSSMGLVMPIYTICIIVFFVYTLSKILFKRTAAPYDHVSSDPQFRRKVFRDESRTSPDKLGPKERDTIVTAISGLVAEVQQQMEASYAQNQQRQDLQDNHARPYTNGTIIHSGPVQIVASEYREPSKEKSPIREEEPTPEPKGPSPEPKEPTPEPTPEKDPSPEPKDLSPEPEEVIPELKELTPEPKDPSPEPEEEKEPTPEEEEIEEVEEIEEEEEEIQEPVKETEDDNNHTIEELKKITDNIETLKDSVVKLTEDFLNKEKTKEDGSKEEKKSTPELLEEALQEDELENPENATVKVMGMELRAHAADGGAWPLQPPPPPAPRPPQPAGEVKSIFLETEIPQQSRVLVAEFGGVPRPDPLSLVVSGKMTLSLIQDEPRETPERDPESTVDDFTTASAMTQPAAEPKDDDLSDEEIEEEIEIEEIEEEVDEEEELEDDEAPKETEEKKN